MRASLVLALLVLYSPALQAGESAAFLKVPIGARAAGMGGAFTAISNDVTAMAWNPAGLSALGARELGLMDAGLAPGVRLDYLGYGHPTAHGSFAAGLTRVSQSSIDSRDASGRPAGSFKAADTAVNFSYGMRMTEGLRLGGTVKYIKSELAEASAQTVAFDLGAMRELAVGGPGVPIVAVAVQNVGPGMRYLDEASQLPLTYAAGVGYRLPLGLTLAADFKHRPHSRGNEFAVGTEYGLFSNFALRAGYGTGLTRGAASGTETGAKLGGLAGGFGVKFFRYRLDYSITPFAELDNVQRISLSARF